MLQTVSLGIFCTMAAFTVGLQTAGDVSFEKSQAAVTPENSQRIAERGDIDGDGDLTVKDAIIIINVYEGIDPATPAMIMRGDTDGDFKITYRDAVRVLYTLSR